MKKHILAWVLLLILVFSFGTGATAAGNTWDIGGGYGTVKATGKGVTVQDNGITYNGYGDLFYKGSMVNKAVAIQFRVEAYPVSGYYFYFGLSDNREVPWNASGNTTQGIISRISMNSNGSKMTLLPVNRLNGSGDMLLQSAYSGMKGMNTSHMAVLYRLGDNWVYVLDDIEVATIGIAATKVNGPAYLVAGSYGSSTMEMTIEQVFIDEEVTMDMKDGTYIKSLAGEETEVQVYYDDNGKLILGETSKAGVLAYEKPTYLVNEMLVAQENISWFTDVLQCSPNTVMVILGCGAGVAVVLSVLMLLLDRRKKKNTHVQEGD